MKPTMMDNFAKKTKVKSAKPTKPKSRTTRVVKATAKPMKAGKKVGGCNCH